MDMHRTWPRLKFMLHREPDTAFAKDAEGYDGSFTFTHALAPVFWLALVGACLLGALCAVGYLTADVDPLTGESAPQLLQKFSMALPAEANVAKNRAALALSGVTLAITGVLALTCLFWAGAAGRHKANAYRIVVLFWVAIFFTLCVLILAWMRASGYEPFASALAGKLLVWNKQAPAGNVPDIGVPEVMFGLACVLPVILATGACLLLQPVTASTNDTLIKARVALLRDRLKELDQLLYLGALTLVFGTLQLSMALSVPMASMPNAADLKIQADLCKSLAPVAASSPFFTPDVVSKVSGEASFGVEQCRKVPGAFAQASVAEDLRQFARGVTLSFGLAFSALLAAIYVPALIGIGILLAKFGKKTGESEDKQSDAAEIDPLRRVAAIMATLSPLLAGLVANAFAAG